MPGAATTIRSGTRDELGGVEIGIVNVWERDERPGVLSALLVAPEQQYVLAAGDRVDLGGRAFRLEALELQGGGTYLCRFTEILDGQGAPPVHPSRRVPIAPIQPADLARRLRERSGNLLVALGAPAGAAIAWEHSARDTYHREWNGGETGPITSLVWTSAPPGAELRVGLDLIRYSPDELYRAEVSAYWKAGGGSVTLFARAEGTAALDAVLTSGALMAEDALALFGLA